MKQVIFIRKRIERNAFRFLKVHHIPPRIQLLRNCVSEAPRLGSFPFRHCIISSHFIRIVQSDITNSVSLD